MRKATEYSEEEQKEAQEVVNVVSKHINNMGFSPEFFIEAMSHEHRTLQQSFTKICIAWFQKLHELGEKGYYDLRNEDSVKLARKLKPVIDEFGGLRFI